jgi:Rps23 Pro-64 3,4-dihydroxylase Tpa1-like proline 4-hydroxylase
MNKLSDYIIVIENAVTPALCDAVLAEYKNCNDWDKAVIRSGEDLNVRNCQTIGLSFEQIIQKNYRTRKELDSYLYISAANVIRKYRKKYPACNIEQDTGYDLLKYEVGQFYTTHTDSFKDNPRAVSCSFVLNDDYEGGEFAFFDRELVYKLKKGSALIFPANFMYPHEVMPVTSGTRYSIVTWFV